MRANRAVGKSGTSARGPRCNSAKERFRRGHLSYATAEWHYGSPCTFVRRSLGMNPDGSLYKPWALHEQVREFEGWALGANAAIVACLTAVLAAVVERRGRRRRGRRFQITLRQLAVSFVVLAAIVA